MLNKNDLVIVDGIIDGKALINEPGIVKTSPKTKNEVRAPGIEFFRNIDGHTGQSGFNCANGHGWFCKSSACTTITLAQLLRYLPQKGILVHCKTLHSFLAFRRYTFLETGHNWALNSWDRYKENSCYLLKDPMTKVGHKSKKLPSKTTTIVDASQFTVDKHGFSKNWPETILISMRKNNITDVQCLEFVMELILIQKCATLEELGEANTLCIKYSKISLKWRAALKNLKNAIDSKIKAASMVEEKRQIDILTLNDNLSKFQDAIDYIRVYRTEAARLATPIIMRIPSDGSCDGCFHVGIENCPKNECNAGEQIFIMD